MDERIHELIAKALAGETTPAESAEVEAWATSAPDNRRYLNSLQQLWGQAAMGRPDPGFVVDTEQALSRVHTALKTPAHRATAPKARVVSMRWWLQAAAAVAVIAVAAVWLLRPGPSGASQTIATADKPTCDTLRDGSVIDLNRNTRLLVKNDYNRRERRLRLEGEAHFKVHPDKEKPFIVEVGVLEVCAVGTAFNVNDFTEPGKVIVTVTEGKVQLQTQGKTLMLVAGQAGVYDKATKTLKLLENPQPVAQYQVRSFHFVHNTTMREIVAKLNAAFETPLVIKSPELENCIIGEIRFSNRSLEQILKTLEETFDFTFRKEGNTYVLEGGCGQ